MAEFVMIDDKHVPLHRILWLSDVPHYCGSEECQHEGEYEIRLDANDSIWTSRAERDATLAALKAWGNEAT